MHASAYRDAAAFAQDYLQRQTSLQILDVGSADINGSLRPIFERDGWEYCGVDLAAGKNVDRVLSSPYEWPELDSDAYDVVVSSQTLEHVPKPWRWLPELVRVVKPGGLVYVCTPHTIHYHPYPVDCWRAWPDGLRALMEDAGLEVLTTYKAGIDTTGIARKPS